MAAGKKPRSKNGAALFVRTDADLEARIRAYAEREDILVSQVLRRCIRIGLATLEKRPAPRGIAP